MANEVEKVKTIAIADIAKINGKTDANIEKIIGLEFVGATLMKGIFGFGTTGSVTGVTNLVSTAGVVATDVSAVGTARSSPAACEYDGDKGIFAYGNTGSKVSTKNLVANTGVVATDVTGVGTARAYIAGCSYN